MFNYFQKAIPSIISGFVVLAVSFFFFTEHKPESDIELDIQVVSFEREIGYLVNSQINRFLPKGQESHSILDGPQYGPLLSVGQTWGVLEKAYIESNEKVRGVQLEVEVRSADILIFQRNDEAAELVTQGVLRKEVILAPKDKLAVYAVRFNHFVTDLDYYKFNIRVSSEGRYFSPIRINPNFSTSVGWVVQQSPLLFFLLVFLGLFSVVFILVMLIFSIIMAAFPSVARWYLRAFDNKEIARWLSVLDEIQRDDEGRYDSIVQLAKKIRGKEQPKPE